MTRPSSTPGPRHVRAPAALLLLALLPPVCPSEASGQVLGDFLPQGERLPVFLAGAREPVASASVLAVSRNPNQHGNGVEVEVSMGHTLPLLLLAGEAPSRPFVLGIEAGVYARFGLQVLERELVATDWYFGVPAVWYREHGWIRFRYFHSSSHLGDEYARRFQDPGVNFSRDAADLFVFSRLSEELGAYGGLRFGYNVKPEDSRRWVVRGGLQREWAEKGQALRPYLASDVEWDQEAGDPRLDLRVGVWLPGGEGRRPLRLSLGFLTGPSPLGQFQGGPTMQLSFGLFGHL